MHYCILNLNALTKAQTRPQKEIKNKFVLTEIKKKKPTFFSKKSGLSFQTVLRWSYCNPTGNHEQHLHTLNRLIISGSSVDVPATRVWLDPGTAAQGGVCGPKPGRVQEGLGQCSQHSLWLSCAKPGTDP